MSKKIEAEGGELVIQSAEGHYAIIPAKDRQYFLDEIADCDDCINNYIQRLPMNRDYAADGSLYPDGINPTKLTDEEEVSYQGWRNTLPKNLQYEDDYDLRGFWKENPTFVVKSDDDHLTDKYKLPNHPTFSSDSIYYSGNEKYGGVWEESAFGNMFVPNDRNLKNYQFEWADKNLEEQYKGKSFGIINNQIVDIDNEEYRNANENTEGYYFNNTGYAGKFSDTVTLKDFDGLNRDVFVHSDEYRNIYPNLTTRNKDGSWNYKNEADLAREQIEKEEFTADTYIDTQLPKWARAVGITRDNMPGTTGENYQKAVNRMISDKLVEKYPQGNMSRAEWFNSLPPGVEQAIKNNPKYQSTIWADATRAISNLSNITNEKEEGVMSLGSILTSNHYSDTEKAEYIQNNKDNPVLSKLEDIGSIAEILTIPAKTVQAFAGVGGNEDMLDALAGVRNDATIMQDIALDPLNFIGIGIWSKLSKANQIRNMQKAYNIARTGDKAELEKFVGKAISNDEWNNYVKSTNANISAGQNSKNSVKNTQLTTPQEFNPANNLVIKSIEDGSPLEKHIGKSGKIHKNSLQAYIDNKNTSKADKFILQKVLDEHFPNERSVNYNEFKNKVSEELVELNKSKTDEFAEYGVEKLGFSSASDLKENKTITFHNEEKFGKGSPEHFEENTLGHSRYLVSNEEPDVFHVLESQSDYYQKSPVKDLLENVKRLEDRVEMLSNPNYKYPENYYGDTREELIDLFGEEKFTELFLNPAKSEASKARFKLKEVQSEITNSPNAIQKQLLGDKHQERLLQENVAYAAENGQTKLRYPTSETAAKIQKYSKQVTTGDNTPGFAKIQEELSIAVRTGDSKRAEELLKEHDKILNTPYEYYLSEHQTILKKYADFPKMAKKTIGVEPKVVTDTKGNTWYEFDIPEDFLKGKGKIRALSTVPGVGIGAQGNVQIKENKISSLSDEIRMDKNFRAKVLDIINSDKSWTAKMKNKLSSNTENEKLIDKVINNFTDEYDKSFKNPQGNSKNYFGFKNYDGEVIQDISGLNTDDIDIASSITFLDEFLNFGNIRAYNAAQIDSGLFPAAKRYDVQILGEDILIEYQKRIKENHLPFGDLIGKGAESRVFLKKGSTDEVIAISESFRPRMLDEDILRLQKMFGDQDNIAIPYNRKTVDFRDMTTNEPRTIDIFEMKNLNKYTKKYQGDPEENFWKLMNDLWDNGFTTELYNPQNVRYSLDKNKYNIFDIEKIDETFKNSKDAWMDMIKENLINETNTGFNYKNAIKSIITMAMLTIAQGSVQSNEEQ